VSESSACARCGESNAAGQRFCSSCGTSLWLPCPSCGEPSPPGARFCGNCGTALDATNTAPPVRSQPVEERRLATVLFADLSGFTALSEHTDPEDVRALVDRCVALLSAIVDRYGGHLDKVIGDAVLAVWGAPVTHEDDAERAVRAALEMQTCAHEHAEDFGGLTLRIGVNSGELMFAPVGPDSHRTQTVMGDVVNTASRLQTSAPRGGVLVGEETWRATRRSIQYEALPPFVVKGKEEPLDAWLAVEPLEATPSERPLSSVRMVGRDRELGLLTATWERAVADRRSHLTVVLGAPGIGKSRLCRELRVQVEGEARVMHGRSLSYGDSMGYSSFAEIVRQALGLLETDRPSDALTKLTQRVQALPGIDANRVIEALSVIIGLGSATVENRPALFDATRQFVEALGREQPTILGFEDLHWAEPTLLDLVEFLASRVRNVPILFLASARPELFDLRPTFGAGLSSYTVLPVAALDDTAAEELTRELFQQHAVAPAVLERISDVAGGNPLFIEELASSVAEGTTDPTHGLPTSVVSIIAARLDALPPHERRLLMDASVIGRVFWPSMLAGLDPSPGLDDSLRSLEDREFIRREQDFDLGADVAYAFRHGSIREVAYNMLPRAERKARHALVASMGEERFGDRPGSFAVVMAHHWKEAGDPERAIGHLVAAAEQADQSWAKQEAVSLYGEALQLLPEGDGRKRTLKLRRALAQQTVSHIRFGDVEVSPEVLEGLRSQPGKSAGET
jgi:class 3 adenylate cyclase